MGESSDEEKRESKRRILLGKGGGDVEMHLLVHFLFSADCDDCGS